MMLGNQIIKHQNSDLQLYYENSSVNNKISKLKNKFDNYKLSIIKDPFCQIGIIIKDIYGLGQLSLYRDFIKTFTHYLKNIIDFQTHKLRYKHFNLQNILDKLNESWVNLQLFISNLDADLLYSFSPFIKDYTKEYLQNHDRLLQKSSYSNYCDAHIEWCKRMKDIEEIITREQRYQIEYSENNILLGLPSLIWKVEKSPYRIKYLSRIGKIEYALLDNTNSKKRKRSEISDNLDIVTMGYNEFINSPITEGDMRGDENKKIEISIIDNNTHKLYNHSHFTNTYLKLREIKKQRECSDQESCTIM